MATSMELGPYPHGGFRLFVSSQTAKVVDPPKDLSLDGQTAVMTGGTAGIGLESAKMLLELGLSRLILAARTLPKGEDIASDLRKAHPKATVEVWPLDMDSYASIQTFAQRCASDLPRIDFAILGAGSTTPYFLPNKETGHEQQIQVNYLSTVLLSILLLPILKAKAPSGKPGRLTIVCSGTALMATFPNHAADPLLPSFDDPKGWGPVRAAESYSTSKFMQQMFVAKLVEHVSADAVVVNLVDPGLVKGTELHRDVKGVFSAVFGLMKGVAGRTLRAGASTYIDAAVVKGKETHGSFVMDWKISPFGALMYKPEGKKTMERLWIETMKEFEFVGALDILRGLKV